MDYCCGCNRKWVNIKKSDKDKYHYKILADEMARFSEATSGYGIMQGWEICRKCRDEWNTKLTADRKRECSSGLGQVDDSEHHPVAGPSSAIDHDRVKGGYESSSTLPSIFSPTSFTPSPPRAEVSVFPPAGDLASDSSDESEEPESPPDNIHDDPDVEPPGEEESLIPSYRVSRSSRQTCIHGCQTSELGRVSAPTRAEILLASQIYIPEGARVCKEHANTITEPNTVHHEWTIEQSVEALNLLKTRVEKEKW